MKKKTEIRLSACMICGTDRKLLREKEICLCSRCITALANALDGKLQTAKEAEKGTP